MKTKSINSIVGAMIATSACATPQYQVSSVGVLSGGTFSEAYAINKKGEVAGQADITGGKSRAIYYHGGVLSTLSPGSGGNHSRAFDINDDSVIAGTREKFYAGTGTMMNQGYMWDTAGAGVWNIGNFGASNLFESTASVVNNSWIVGGSASGKSGFYELNPMTWERPNVLNWLGTKTGSPSSSGNVTGINDYGDTCGWSEDSNGMARPFQKIGNTMYQLNGVSVGVGIFTDTLPYDMNNSEVMVGHYKVDFNTFRAFKRASGGSFLSLGKLSGIGSTDDDSSTATAINANGDIVGYSEIGNTNNRAFLVPNGGSMVDLNTYLPAGSGWVLQFAYDINEYGWICGTGTLFGEKRGFILKPQVNVSGQVSLQSYGQPISAYWMTFEISDAVTNTVLESKLVQLGPGGTYSFSTDKTGPNKRISLKYWHWLRQSMTGTIGSNPIDLDFNLTNGDVDGDNEINLVDFGRISASYGKAYGEPGFDTSADLDGDFEVTIVDAGILSANYGQMGDE